VQMPHHILTTRMELWGFIKSSVPNRAIHMELSLHLSFYLKHTLGGYTVDTTVGFPVKIMEALAPQYCHNSRGRACRYIRAPIPPLVERTFCTTHSTEGSWATVGVKYPRDRRTLVTAQNSRYKRFPPIANCWGTIHPILEKAPPLRAKEGGAGGGGTNLKSTNPRSNPCHRFHSAALD
jgi:hypothetical protein